MSQVTGSRVFIFHTDLGPVVAQVDTVENYNVENIVHNRALAQALRCKYVNLGQRASPNDPKAARTVTSIFTSNTEVLS